MQAAQGSGAEDVFLYSKALMRQNAPAPLPERLAPINVSGVAPCLTQGPCSEGCQLLGDRFRQCSFHAHN